MTNHVEKLTGRTRYRESRRLFGSSKLILQIEVHRSGLHPDPLGPYVDYRPYSMTYWRDAKVSDLTENAISSVALKLPVPAIA